MIIIYILLIQYIYSLAKVKNKSKLIHKYISLYVLFKKKFPQLHIICIKYNVKWCDKKHPKKHYFQIHFYISESYFLLLFVFWWKGGGGGLIFFFVAISSWFYYAWISRWTDDEIFYLMYIVLHVSSLKWHTINYIMVKHYIW